MPTEFNSTTNSSHWVESTTRDASSAGSDPAGERKGLLVLVPKWRWRVHQHFSHWSQMPKCLQYERCHLVPWHSLERFWVPIAARPNSSRAEESNHAVPLRQQTWLSIASFHSRGCRMQRRCLMVIPRPYWSHLIQMVLFAEDFLVACQILANLQVLKVSWILRELELIHSNICVFDLIVHQMKSNGGKLKQLQICKNEIVNTNSQISFLHRVAGNRLRDKVRGSE